MILCVRHFTDSIVAVPLSLIISLVIPPFPGGLLFYIWNTAKLTSFVMISGSFSDSTLRILLSCISGGLVEIFPIKSQLSYYSFQDIQIYTLVSINLYYNFVFCSHP